MSFNAAIACIVVFALALGVVGFFLTSVVSIHAPTRGLSFQAVHFRAAFFIARRQVFRALVQTPSKRERIPSSIPPPVHPAAFGS